MTPSTCLGCGGEIRLDEPYEVPDGVIARGDRLMHAGCVLNSEAISRGRTAGPLAYFVPRDW